MINNLASVQPKVVKILENSFLNNRISHAYIFSGKKGTYKKDAALYFAMMLYCGVNPCMKCDNCRNIMSLTHPNVYFIEPTGKTVKKEQVLALQEEFSKTSLVAGPRIYIIDQADTMTTSAMNSLLKFIEEPVGKDTYGILITEHYDNLLATIRSRAINITFDDLSKEALRSQIEESQVDPKYIDQLAYLTSNIDAALEILDSDSFTKSSDCLSRFVKALLDKDISLFVRINRSFFTSRDDTSLFLNLLEGFYRDLLEYKACKKVINFRNLEHEAAIISAYYNLEDLIDIIMLILDIENRIDFYVNINLTINELIMKLEEVASYESM